MEFATGENPTQPGAAPMTNGQIGDALEFTYTRNKAAMSELQFAVEWSDSLSALSWTVAGVSEIILSDDGTVQRVKAMVPLAAGSRLFVRLRVFMN
ncbi:MAG: hypothetical protein ACR2OZ_13155 [Verrucomicrobiales bacterium]